MNTSAKDQAHLDALARAWDIVNPRSFVLRLAKRGFVSMEDAEKVSWKEPIAALVSELQLQKAAVTIENVGEAITFYTATEATITEEKLAFAPSSKGYLVMSIGYGAGPAR